MEKLAYQLWKKDDDSLEIFKEALLKNLSRDIGEFVSELQINIADSDVIPANNLAQSNYPPAPNAVIFMKVKSYFLADTLESHLEKITNKIHGFVVSESIILDNTEKSPLGLRSEGFSQVVFWRSQKQCLHLTGLIIGLNSTQKSPFKPNLILFMCKIQSLDPCRKNLLPLLQLSRSAFHQRL